VQFSKDVKRPICPVSRYRTIRIRILLADDRPVVRDGIRDRDGGVIATHGSRILAAADDLDPLSLHHLADYPVEVFGLGEKPQECIEFLRRDSSQQAA
jgi:hypothetical protein